MLRYTDIPKHFKNIDQGPRFDEKGKMLGYSIVGGKKGFDKTMKLLEEEHDRKKKITKFNVFSMAINKAA